jgi:hypothetical protein
MRLVAIQQCGGHVERNNLITIPAAVLAGCLTVLPVSALAQAGVAGGWGTGTSGSVGASGNTGA